MKRLVSVGLVASIGFSLVGACSGSGRVFGQAGGADSGGANAGRGPAAGAAGEADTSGGQAGADETSAGAAGTEAEGGMAGEINEGGAGGTIDETGGTANGGAPPTCNACANGFACSTSTCKTTCAAD